MTRLRPPTVYNVRSEPRQPQTAPTPPVYDTPPERGDEVRDDPLHYFKSAVIVVLILIGIGLALKFNPGS